MGKNDFVAGTATTKQFFDWINERHSIWCRRRNGQKKPWTKDPILMDWKFTNVFRELDKGTIALKKSILQGMEHVDPKLIIWNIIWYRLFNHYEHAYNMHFIESRIFLYDYLRKRWRDGEKVFTSAHLTTGRPFEDKVDTYIDACEDAWEKVPAVLKTIRESGSMQATFETLQDLQMVGPFVAYEIVCDLRWTKLMTGENWLSAPPDRLTWANMGGGAQRGLQRLGMPAFNKDVGLKSMACLWAESESFLQDHVKKHKELPLSTRAVEYPPFELREIEHSLCEFDKYERIRLNQGRPRQKYDGR
jgi:hypothetical protein